MLVGSMARGEAATTGDSRSLSPRGRDDLLCPGTLLITQTRRLARTPRRSPPRSGPQCPALSIFGGAAARGGSTQWADPPSLAVSTPHEAVGFVSERRFLRSLKAPPTLPVTAVCDSGVPPRLGGGVDERHRARKFERHRSDDVFPVRAGSALAWHLMGEGLLR